MAEPSTVARPYAEAAFRLADDKGALAAWSGMLAALAAVAADDRVRAAVADPKLSDAQAAGVFISILSGKLNGDAENFVRVLAENKRLDLLPEINAQYDLLKNEREGVIDATVFTAFELSEAQATDLVQRLEKKTGRRIKPRFEVDSSLIAGVKVVLGDKVIDASARAQLGALDAALKA
jgi:F-type H+-transporting ATPase subunit delta